MHLPLARFAYNNSYQATIGMPPYEALYGRKCQSPLHWDEVGEKAIVGPEFIHEAVEKIRGIRQRMKAAQDRYKSYADKRRRPLEFQVGDHVFLRVSPTKGVVRFGVRGKLNPRYIGPFDVLERIGASGVSDCFTSKPSWSTRRFSHLSAEEMSGRSRCGD